MFPFDFQHSVFDIHVYEYQQAGEVVTRNSLLANYLGGQAAKFNRNFRVFHKLRSEFLVRE